MCADRNLAGSTLEGTTLEDWAQRYIESTDLDHKLAPPPPPTAWRQPTPAPKRLVSAGRPPELEVVARAPRSPTRSQMGTPKRRAQLLHTFLHHELQAAELMCWAILAFPDTPRAFRQGLLGICQDEIRHMGLYRQHLVVLGHDVGDFPVRDWFWQRVASCERPLQFVALMGMGLEAGNLDHTKRYEEWFREVGDHEGAALQRIVGDEEVAHVQFACHWFRRWTGDDDFENWRQELVTPLTPSMMKGNELDRERRGRAGFSGEFLRQLENWQPS
ncbi:MAG: ferritin-like domain-containing protein [bacterium]|nr:ferritin-like domain-containing protein [bacterium]